MATQTPMESAVDLFAEMRHDVKEMASTLIEIKEQFKFWLPKWEQQTHAMITLENEVASLRNQLIRHKEDTESKVERMKEDIAAKETAEQKLEAIADQARKERRDTFRWVVGAALSAAGLTIALIVFLIQHVSLK